MESDRIIGDCVLRAKALQSISDRIRNEEFPSPAPMQLSQILANLAEAITEKLIYTRYSAQYEESTYRNFIEVIDQLVKWLFGQLRFADGAITQHVPWSLITPLQEFTSRLLNNTKLIVRPIWRYNYSVLLSDVISSINKAVYNALGDEKTEECIGDMQGALYIVSFPFIERKSVLQHAAFAHEIGHIIAEGFLSEEKGVMPPEFHKQIVESVKKNDQILPLFKKSEVSRQLSECAEYRRRAVQELGSDLVAVNMIGPASIFSLDSIIGMRKLDVLPSPGNERYPPRRYRLRTMMQEMQDQFPALTDWELLQEITPPECEYILSAYQKYISALEDTLKIESDMHLLKSDTTINIAYSWLLTSMNELKDYVRLICSDKTVISSVLENNIEKPEDEERLKGAKFWLDSIRLAHSRLGRNLPPNTYDDTSMPPKPAGFENIMNAGWLYSLSESHQCPQSKDSIEQFIEIRQRTERLVLRALELSAIQDRYLDYLENK